MATGNTTEKVIIKGDLSNINTLASICFGGAVLCFITAVALEYKRWNFLQKMGHEYELSEYIARIPTMGEPCSVFFWVGIAGILLGIMFIIKMNFCEIVVTNRRTYGKTAFGKRIDLPLDKVSSVGTVFPKGIFVATSSGVVKFWLLKNRNEVYEAISALLQSRQSGEGG